MPRHETPKRCPAGPETLRSRAQLLGECGADTLQHLNGNLLDHLERTEGILLDWGGSEALALTGLCHATYGTDGFASSLLSLDERARLSDAVGPEVESAVYFYASCDRGFLYPQIRNGRPATFKDRLTDAVIPLAEGQLRPFVDLTLANEADVALSGSPSMKPPGWFASLVDDFGPMASPRVAEACEGLAMSSS